MTESSIDDLERTADRLTGHGIAGLTLDDWPVLVSALEDYISIRKACVGWDDAIQRAVDSTKST